MEKIPMTAAGYAALSPSSSIASRSSAPASFSRLPTPARTATCRRTLNIMRRRSRQSLNEGRIAELEDKLARADIIDVSKLSGDTITFGATVTLVDEDTDEKKVWQTSANPRPMRRKARSRSPRRSPRR